MLYIRMLKVFVNPQNQYQKHEYKVYGYTSTFSAIFTKGDNCHDFPLASLDNVALQKGIYSLRKEFAPTGANSFL